jgi:hypothetical protein
MTCFYACWGQCQLGILARLEREQAVSILSRLLLIAGTVVATALLLVRIELAGADWYDRFNSSSVYRELGTWTIAIGTLTRPGNLLFAAPVLPTLLAIALSRRLRLQVLAFAPMAILTLGVLLDSGTMHHCDRKGCTGCDAIGVWVLVIQLPICTLLTIGLLVQRLMEAYARPRLTSRQTQGGMRRYCVFAALAATYSRSIQW